MTGIGRLAFVSSLLVAAGCGGSSSPVAPSATPAGSAALVEESGSAPEALAARRGPAVAAAAPITVDRGSFDYRGRTGGLVLRGSRGFSLSARVNASAVTVGVDDSCAPLCPPVVTIPVLSMQTGSGLTAKVTLDGQVYSNVGDGSGAGSATLSFAATAVPVPTTKRSKVVVSTPFSLVGQFAHESAGSIVSEPLSGHGTVRASLVWNGARWNAESLSFTLEP